MRRRSKYLPLLLPLLAAALLVLVFARTMGHSAQRLAGSNSVPPEALVVQVGGGSRVCQGILAPRNAASVHFFVDSRTHNGPPLTMRLGKDGRTLATSHIAGGWSGGTIRMPFRTLSRNYLEARICLWDEGHTPIRFIGLSTSQPTSTVVGRTPQYGALSIEFFRPGQSDSWALLPTIATRAGILKGSLAGGWSFWFAIALVLVAGAGAIALSLGGVRQ